uniref:Uncharacterized protein n=1 Tax=Timema bartmani TaxID=61472 RepID=A0A7R9EX36_9NEOP|nr:unnamed protein product [Timema bartmani]
MSSFCQLGTFLGNILCKPLSGFLCSKDGAGEWALVFYVFGAVGVLWYLLWYCFVYDSPKEHPRITKEEKRYIETSLGNMEQKPERGNRWEWPNQLLAPPRYSSVFRPEIALVRRGEILALQPLRKAADSLESLSDVSWFVGLLLDVFRHRVELVHLISWAPHVPRRYTALQDFEPATVTCDCGWSHAATAATDRNSTGHRRQSHEINTQISTTNTQCCYYSNTVAAALATSPAHSTSAVTRAAIALCHRPSSNCARIKNVIPAAVAESDSEYKSIRSSSNSHAISRLIPLDESSLTRFKSEKPIPVLCLPSARTVFNVRCLAETSSCAMPALCQDCVQCAVPCRNLFLCYVCPLPGLCSMCGVLQKPLPVLCLPSVFAASTLRTMCGGLYAGACLLMLGLLTKASLITSDLYIFINTKDSKF